MGGGSSFLIHHAFKKVRTEELLGRKKAKPVFSVFNNLLDDTEYTNCSRVQAPAG